MWNDTIDCPVCKRKLLEVGMRNHIYGTAKGELFRWYFNRKLERNHLKYIETHVAVYRIKKIKLEIT